MLQCLKSPLNVRRTPTPATDAAAVPVPTSTMNGIHVRYLHNHGSCKRLAVASTAVVAPLNDEDKRLLPGDNDGNTNRRCTVKVDNNGQTISISIITERTSTTRLFSAPLLWVNDPNHIHPSSGQRLRTLGKYTSTNSVIDAKIVTVPLSSSSSSSSSSSTVTHTTNESTAGDDASGGKKSIAAASDDNDVDISTIHPPPLPRSFHPRGGIYEYKENQPRPFNSIVDSNTNDCDNLLHNDHQRDLLKIDWKDGDTTYVDLEWLLEGQNCEEWSSQGNGELVADTTRVTKRIAIRSCDANTTASRSESSRSRNSDSSSITSFEYKNVMDDEGILLNAMQEIFEKGAILIKNGPIFDSTNTIENERQEQQLQQESVVGDLGKRFSGGILSHGSLYGDIFHVQTKAHAENIAYTNVALPPHQDLTYYESKPFLQLLHCVNNSSNDNEDSRIEGGESVLIDAMAAAEELRHLAPDLFDVLCHREAIFLKERDQAGMISPKPHIVCDPTFGQVVEINWSPPFEGPLQPDPNIPVEQYVRAYQAMECMLNIPVFSNENDGVQGGNRQAQKDCNGSIGSLLPPDLRRKLQDYAIQYTWQYALERGDILVFNNQRMLHGRRGFVSISGGQRHLIGCYTESDATISQYRQLLRDFSPNLLRFGPEENDRISSATVQVAGYGNRNAGNGCRWI